MDKSFHVSALQYGKDKFRVKLCRRKYDFSERFVKPFISFF